MTNLKNKKDLNKLERYIASSSERYAKYGVDVESDSVLGLTIGCNVGNYYTKVASDFGKDIFKTTATLISENDGVGVRAGVKNGTEEKVIEINGSLYRVGIGDNISGDIKNRVVESMQAVVLYSIAKQLVKKKSLKKTKLIEVNLCVGLPIVEYNDVTNHEHLIKSFVGEFKIAYQSMEFIISISKKFFRISAEGYAHLQVNTDKYFNSDIYDDVYLVDVGSRTVDSCHLTENSIVATDSMRGSGTLALIKKLNAYVSKDANVVEVEEKKIEKLVRTGISKVGTMPVKLSSYDKVVTAYKNQVIAKLKEKYTDIEQADLIVFVGGGAYLFKDDLQNYFKQCEVEFVNKAEFANADAYYILALERI